MKKLFLLVFFLVISIGNLSYASLREFSLNELVAQSEIIAVATLKSANKLPSGTEGVTLIENTIVLEEILKGSNKATDELIVNTSTGLEDSPAFEMKTKFIVFLTKIENGKHYMTTNAIQGLWPLDKQGNTTATGSGKTKKQLIEAIKKLAN